MCEATHVDDLIGTFIGGNAATGGVKGQSLGEAHGSYTGSLPQLGTQLKDQVDRIWGSGTKSIEIYVSPRNSQK